MALGQEATPGDVQSTDKLKRYWTHGAGAQLIRWGVPGDFDRCVTQVSRFMPPEQARGYCSNLHVAALGVRPGMEDGGRRGRNGARHG